MKTKNPAELDPAALERLAAAIRIPTMSESEDEVFRLFQAFLAKTYPLFHTHTERFPMGPRALVYKWAASTSETPHADADEKPVLILSHYDVVPIGEAPWSCEPFGGDIKDGYLWGRGSLDTKTTIFWPLEAAEELMRQGSSPRADIWFAFGGDEEISGLIGAKNIAQWFKKQGISFSWLLDEGSIVAEGMIPKVKSPLALVGIEEKGYADIELIVEQASGHASRPPQEQAAAILGRALVRLAKKPFPWQLSPGVQAFFKQLSFLVSGPSAWVLRHARLLGPLFFPLVASSDSVRALLRSTLAMTCLEGSSASNVLPNQVKATLNLRLLEPWTVEKAIVFVTKTIADSRVSVQLSPQHAANNPVPAGAAHTKNPGWQHLCLAIEEAFPGIPVLPFLNTATTDSRHYATLCDAVFRFSPMSLNPEELARIHAQDERISLENIERGLVFYRSLFTNLCHIQNN